MASHSISVFARIFGVGLLAIGLGNYLLAQVEIRYETAKALSSERQTVQLASQPFIQHLRRAGEEIRFLARQPGLTALREPLQDAPVERITRVFANHLDTHSYFSQLRWIDLAGNERIRADHVDGLTRITPTAQLQNKSDRRYVSDALELPAGAFYVSPFDLNVEGGQIEVPYRPTIRLSTPVFNDEGMRMGVLVLNSLASGLLDEFANAAGGRAVNLSLLNRQGYWLRSENGEDEWAFMFDRPRTFAQRNRAVWDAINASDEGQKRMAEGLWTWMSIYPLKEVERRQDGTIDPTTRIYHDREYAWRVVLLLPQAQLTAISVKAWRDLAGGMALMVAGLAIAALVFARTQGKILALNVALRDRAKEAEAATTAKAQFLANMSHEIRTPMNAIVGLTHVLDRSQLPADAGALVRKIRNAGSSLLMLINDILDFSKIESGKLELESRPFSLFGLLDNMATIMGTAAQDKDIELLITPPPPEMDELIGDAVRLEQVLINLIGNAVKFTHQGSVAVCVEAKAMDPLRASLQFSVRDTGIGIAKDVQQRLFQPFIQADLSTTREFGGTGLGLAISRQLVALMGGEIRLNSEPGVGSEFLFSVTFDRGKPSHWSSPGLAGLHVLIADDNPVAVDALRVTAECLGWTVRLARSGTQAVDQAMKLHREHHGKEVLLIDWQMPDMDGLAVCREIRDRIQQSGAGSDRYPRVVIVTSHSQKLMDTEPAYDLVHAVLAKPVTASSLYDAVARAHADDAVKPQVMLQTPAAQQLLGVRMLIVDDNDINREVAQRIFAAEGAQVALAVNGRESLEWLGRHSDAVDIVLMDIQMPVMDGLEATRRIRTMAGLSDLPVIALTAGVFKEQQVEAYAAGMNGFLTKPFEVEKTVGLIRQWISAPQTVSADSEPDSRAADAAPASAAPTVHDAIERSYPGMDLAKAGRIWGDPLVHQQWLRRFARDYADSAASMQSASWVEAQALAHKMIGAAGNLALVDVEAAARDICDAASEPADAQALFDRLDVALDTAKRTISAYAPALAETHPSEPPGQPGRSIAVRELLQCILTALGEDNPNAVEPHLASIAQFLSTDQLDPLKHSVEEFDFRKAEMEVRKLAGELGYPLES